MEVCQELNVEKKKLWGLMAFSASKKYKFQHILFLTTNPGFVEMCLFYYLKSDQMHM